MYAILLLMVQLGLVVFTWHDMAVSQGVGLYLTMEFGAESRTVFDLLTDGCCAISFVVVILLPVLVLKHKQPIQILRFTSVYLVFMPMLNPAKLVHLFDGHNLFDIRIDMAISVNILFGFLKEVVPLLFLLVILCKKNGYTVPKWHWAVGVAELVLGIGLILFPEISDVCCFWMYYLLIVLGFERWEKLLEKERVLWEKLIVWLIFALCYFRGCVRMLTLMAIHHL